MSSISDLKNVFEIELRWPQPLSLVVKVNGEALTTKNINNTYSVEGTIF